MKKFLFIFGQYLAPHHFVSRAAGWLANAKTPWLKNFFIKKFIRAFDVNMAEAQHSEAESYPCFNAFFTRALKPDARPIERNQQHILSPADGAFSQLGKIRGERIFQAKNRDYSCSELLASARLAELFADGDFATIYLSPKDYHRLHMPCDGILRSMTYVPGDLFSVNPTTTENVERVFARNERLVCLFDTAAGPMALVLVGAMIVAAIETVWAGLIEGHRHSISTQDYQDQTIAFKQGEEFGRFQLGSTIILLFANDQIDWQHERFSAGSKVQLGNVIASLMN